MLVNNLLVLPEILKAKVVDQALKTTGYKEPKDAKGFTINFSQFFENEIG